MQSLCLPQALPPGPASQAMRPLPPSWMPASTPRSLPAQRWLGRTCQLQHRRSKCRCGAGLAISALHPLLHTRMQHCLLTALPSQLYSLQLEHQDQCIHTSRHLWLLPTQESIRRLNSILRGEVISKQPELLAQVGHLREAEPALRRITSAADGLQAELRRACSEVQAPYLRLQRDAVKLRNLQGTVELLRHTMQRWGRWAPLDCCFTLAGSRC